MQHDCPGPMFGVFSLPLGQNNKRTRARRHPGLGLDDDRPADLVFIDKDTVQAEVLNAHAVGQAANFQRNPAQVALTAL